MSVLALQATADVCKWQLEEMAISKVEVIPIICFPEWEKSEAKLQMKKARLCEDGGNLSW